MSLDASALTLVATMEDELDLTAGSETPRLERYIHTASDAIVAYLGRALHYGTGLAETLTGTCGRTSLVISRYPMASVASVVDGDGEDLSDYESDLATGILTLDGGWPDEVVVTYAGGWVTPRQVQLDSALVRSLPRDIEHACILTVVNLRSSRGRDPNISTEAFGPTSVGYAGFNTAIGRGSSGIIPDVARAILEPYRARRL
jgi:hypothetical protein